MSHLYWYVEYIYICYIYMDINRIYICIFIYVYII